MGRTRDGIRSRGGAVLGAIVSSRPSVCLEKNIEFVSAGFVQRALMSGRYESKSDGDGLEELTKKLTNDLRKNVRELVRGAA